VIEGELTSGMQSSYAGKHPNNWVKFVAKQGNTSQEVISLAQREEESSERPAYCSGEVKCQSGELSRGRKGGGRV